MQGNMRNPRKFYADVRFSPVRAMIPCILTLFPTSGLRVKTDTPGPKY